MKTEFLEDEKGYMLSEQDFRELKRIEANGKVQYFLPFRFHRQGPLDIEVLLTMINEGKTKKEICQELGCDVTRLNNSLQRRFNTTKLNMIKEN